LAEAERVSREALEMKKILGREHKDVANFLGELASVLRREGKLEEAENVYREALTICTNLSLVDPLKADLLNDLGHTLLEQGKGSKALVFIREGITIRQELFGRESPEVASTLLNLAVALQNQGRLTEAETSYREALTLREKLDKNDPEPAVVFANLATLLTGRQGGARPSQFSDSASPFAKARRQKIGGHLTRAACLAAACSDRKNMQRLNHSWSRVIRGCSGEQTKFPLKAKSACWRRPSG